MHLIEVSTFLPAIFSAWTELQLHIGYNHVYLKATCTSVRKIKSRRQSWLFTKHTWVGGTLQVQTALSLLLYTTFH